MSLTIDLGPSLAAGEVHILTYPRMSAEEFSDFCRRNPDLRSERTAEGEVLVMPPTGAGTGSRSIKIARQLDEWAERDGTGIAFDSSTGFLLPNGATRSPDASWVRNARWAALTDAEQEKFAPLCPDFVVELMSPTDRLEATQAKMEEYRANGASQGWRIDRKNRQVHVYRPGQPPEVLDDPQTLSGDPILSGFVLQLGRIL